jgi:hypothetical protein
MQQEEDEEARVRNRPSRNRPSRCSPVACGNSCRARAPVWRQQFVNIVHTFASRDLGEILVDTLVGERWVSFRRGFFPPPINLLDRSGPPERKYRRHCTRRIL